MISIFLKEENSIINSDKFIYTQIHYENVIKQPNDYQYTKQFCISVVFEDGLVKRISPFYDNRKDAEIFISCLFGKIKYIEDRHNIFIDASEIDLEVQKRKKTNNSNNSIQYA